MLIEGNCLSVGGEYMKVKCLHLTKLLACQVRDQLIQQQACYTLLPELLTHAQGEDVSNFGASTETIRK